VMNAKTHGGEACTITSGSRSVALDGPLHVLGGSHETLSDATGVIRGIEEGDEVIVGGVPVLSAGDVPEATFRDRAVRFAGRPEDDPEWPRRAIVVAYAGAPRAMGPWANDYARGVLASLVLYAGLLGWGVQRFQAVPQMAAPLPPSDCATEIERRLARGDARG